MARVFNFENVEPLIIRRAIAEGQIETSTKGMSRGYIQANIAVLPADQTLDYIRIASEQNESWKLLEILTAGNPMVQKIAEGADVRNAVPKYHIYQRGKLVEEVTDINTLWQDNFVCVLSHGDCLTLELLDTPIIITHAPEHMLITDLKR